MEKSNSNSTIKSNQNNMEILQRPVAYVKGIGEKRAADFKKLGIWTVYDLITYYPRTYEDRSVMATITEAVNQEACSVKGQIYSRVEERRTRSRMTIYKVQVRDDTAVMDVIWFNQTYIKNALEAGAEYVFYGNVIYEAGKLVMKNPVFEKWKEDAGAFDKTCKIVPIYPLTAGVTQYVVRNAVKNALAIANDYLMEYMPDEIRRKYNLAERNYSVYNIHFAQEAEAYEFARERLVFDELFLFRLALLHVKQTYGVKSGLAMEKKEAETAFFQSNLPYRLTEAQARVVKEIVSDMTSGEKAMNRLVQGDVGSGKTVVAAIAMLLAVKNGYQAVLMAPTEILARQHYHFFTDVFACFEEQPVRIALLTGGMRAKEKRRILEQLELGIVHIVIGTHALIQGNVAFENLGLVITDEQHRFGVRQRTVLHEKGDNPHVLVMTATPIPRTLALILYGDMDISVIDELPPGRKPVRTFAVTEAYRERINRFIEKKVAEGRQVFIVCPLVDESDVVPAKAATLHAEQYATVYFPSLRTALVHGKMKSKQKDAMMQGFLDGEYDILIATTVIEVGVNIPNASVMIIENAERFGLAQLHQLRGRVGRGEHESICVLLYNSKSETVQERMKIMEQTNDGFVISEKDLALRGPGDFFGTRQHGLPEFKIANLYKDIRILAEAQQAAEELFEADPTLELPAHIRLAEHVETYRRKSVEHTQL